MNEFLPIFTKIYYFKLDKNKKMNLVEDSISGRFLGNTKWFYVTPSSIFPVDRIGRNVFLSHEDAYKKLNNYEVEENTAKRRKIDKECGIGM